MEAPGPRRDARPDLSLLVPRRLRPRLGGRPEAGPAAGQRPPGQGGHARGLEGHLPGEPPRSRATRGPGTHSGTRELPTEATGVPEPWDEPRANVLLGAPLRGGLPRGHGPADPRPGPDPQLAQSQSPQTHLKTPRAPPVCVGAATRGPRVAPARGPGVSEPTEHMAHRGGGGLATRGHDRTPPPSRCLVPGASRWPHRRVPSADHTAA